MKIVKMTEILFFAYITLSDFSQRKLYKELKILIKFDISSFLSNITGIDPLEKIWQLFLIAQASFKYTWNRAPVAVW